MIFSSAGASSSENNDGRMSVMGRVWAKWASSRSVSAIGLSVWKDGVVFAILIIVLIFKPTGILGKKINEKV